MPTKIKKKPKRIRFSGYTKEESEAIHDKVERVARALVTPVKKEKGIKNLKSVSS